MGKYPFVGFTLAAFVGVLLADYLTPTFRVALLTFLAAFVVWGIVKKTATLLILLAATFLLMHALQFDRNPARQLKTDLGAREMTVAGSGVVDSVPSVITSSNGKVRSEFELKRSVLSNGANNLSLLVNWPDATPQIGDRLEFEGTLSNIAPPRNPGEFDYAAWLARRQIFSLVNVAYAKDAHVFSVGSEWNLRRLANRIKLKLANIITRDLTASPVEAGVISAMMLGTKDDTPDSTLELFMRTGTFHLFSVSGLHVTMLAAITLFFLTTLRVPRRSALFLTIPAVFAYALITGWSPSSVRAAIMTSIFVIATLADRPSLSINTLALACFFILIGNTNQLFAAGFQLSFSVVAVIILCSSPLSQHLQKLCEPDPFLPKKLLTPFQRSRWLLGNSASRKMALTLTAWAGSLPMTAWYFSLLSPAAVIANLLVIPVAFGILGLAVLSVLSSIVSSTLLVAFNNANWALVKSLLAILAAVNSLPGSSMFVGSHWWQRPSQQRVTVFDLGCGGATAIETSGHCWLVDCGSDSDYRRVVRHYLQQRGINRVDGIFLTHGDGTHVGGIGQFRMDFPEAAVYVPEAGRKSLVFRRLIDPKTVHWISSGTSFELDRNARIDVLWPPPVVDSGRADDHAFLLKLTLENQRFLLAGDTGFTAEMELMTHSATTLKSDWLVLGRDRDDPGGARGFFQKVGAKTVLTTGKKFPSPERVPVSWIEICRKLHMKLVRFDESGAVQVDVDNGLARMKTFAEQR